MRLFFAVELDEGVRTAAADTARAMAAALDRRGVRRGVSWVAAENLHVTLHFLGEVAPPTARALVDRVQAPLDIAPFDLSLGGIGTFPPSGSPRVIWIGLSHGATELTAVHAAVGRRIDGLGLRLDPRPFSAHLTLGRVKAPIGGRLSDTVAEARLAREARCRIGRVTLFESRLLPRGAAYAVIATTALGYHQPS
jgi:2'-5' RNA ligase